MTRGLLAALFATLFAATAIAMPAEIDTDGDGQATLAELKAKYPDVSEDTFAEMDTNEDGFLNDEEMSAAITAKLLPELEGSSD